MTPANASGIEPSLRVQGLVEEMSRLPTQPNAAMRVLWALDDPTTSAGELARLVESDPALSAKVMRLANSAHYGMFRRVSSAAHAIMVVGFVTVRALAVGSACGLFVEKRRTVPEKFWEHSAAVAAGATIVAEYTNASICDAFSAGLLHDIGTALLFRQSPEDYEMVAQFAASHENSLVDAEIAVLGATHTWVGGAVLEAWNFPEHFVQSVTGHHTPSADVSALAKAVFVGEALAGHLGFTMALDDVTPLEESFAAAGMTTTNLDELCERVAHQIEETSALFDW